MTDQFDHATVKAVARAIARHSDPDKAQMWEAISALRTLAALGWQQVPPGCVVVPREPTQEQIRAAIERPHTKSEDMYHSIYRAMVGAAKLDDEE